MQIYLGAVADLQMNLQRSSPSLPLSISPSLPLCLAARRTWGPVDISPIELLAGVLISR